MEMLWREAPGSCPTCKAALISATHSRIELTTGEVHAKTVTMCTGDTCKWIMMSITETATEKMPH